MLYESSMPFIGMIANGAVSGMSENRDGTPLLRPDETLLYETSSGESIIFLYKTTNKPVSKNQESWLLGKIKEIKRMFKNTFDRPCYVVDEEP